jgi:hypothetical protein
MTKLELVNELVEVIDSPAEGFSQDDLRNGCEKLVDACIKDNNVDVIKNFINEKKNKAIA